MPSSASASQSGSSLRRELRGHVLVLTFDRPERLNALDASLREGIPVAVREARIFSLPPVAMRGT